MDLVQIKIKLRSLKSSDHINAKGDGPYRSFGYLSLFSDSEILQHGAKENYCNFESFNRVVDTKTNIILMGQLRLRK